LADSSFPSGGFGHSGGLEAAWQLGEVRSSAELAQFIQANVAQTSSAALPFLNEAYFEPERIEGLDMLYDVFLSNHVANRASRAQGQGWLIALERAFALPQITALREKVLAQPGHFAPVFGAASALLCISHGSAQRLFLFLAVRGLVTSAVRLGIVGPLEAQGIQFHLMPEAEVLCARCAKLRVADAAQTAPLLDILHGAHDRLYSRLFQS
jgi:urease accessory protein